MRVCWHSFPFAIRAFVDDDFIHLLSVQKGANARTYSRFNFYLGVVAKIPAVAALHMAAMIFRSGTVYVYCI